MNKEGKEVEPSKEVAVSITFKDSVQSTDFQSEWKLYHFVDNDVNKVEDITEAKTTDINQDESENVHQVEFKAENFSVYTIAGVSYENFSGYITAGSFQGTTVETITSNGNSLSTDLKLSYDIPKTALNSSLRYAVELPANTTWGSLLQPNQEYTGKDGNRDAFKYRFVEQDGKKFLVLEFLPTYVAGSGEKVTGDITYNATIGQVYRKSNGDYVLPFTDKVTITVPSTNITPKVEETPGDFSLTSTKSGKVTYNGDEAYLDYTVTLFSSKGTKDSVKVSDVLTAQGLSIESLSIVKVERRDNLNWVGDTGTNPQTISGYQINKSADNKSFNLTLPKLSAKQAYTVTYRYKVSNLPAGTDFTANNQMTAETPEVPNSNSGTWLTLHRNKISKTGTYNKDTNQITWTITVNENQNDIAGTELSDDMIAKASNLKIEPTNGATKTNTGYRFSATSDGKNTNKYVITYTTTAPAPPTNWGAGAGQVKNTVNLTDNGQTSTASTTVQTGTGATGGLTKSFEKMEATSQSDVKILTWKSIVQMPGDGVIPKGTEITDSVGVAGNLNIAGHYFTKAQLTTIYQNLVSIFGAGKFKLEVIDENYYPSYDYSQLVDNKSYWKFTVKLLEDFRTSAKQVELNYQSTMNVNSGSLFTNIIESGSHNSLAKYIYTVEDKVFKMDGRETDHTVNDYVTKDTAHTIDKNGTISWNVKVLLDDTATSATVVDTPPAGLTLTGFAYGNQVYGINADQFTIANSTITWNNPYYKPYKDILVEGSISPEGVVTVNFTAQNGKTLKEVLGNTGKLYANFTFKSNATPLDENLVKKYTNKASASLNGTPIGEDDHTQTITHQPGKKLEKDGVWKNNDRQLDYSVVVNPDAQDLAAGHDFYTLTDILSYQEDVATKLSYDLKQESVKLLDSNNQEINPNSWSWTVEKNRDASGLYRSVLKVSIPNNQKFTLKYSYLVSREVAADNVASLSVKNTAEIEGLKTGKVENTEQYNWEKLATSGTAHTSRSYKITKVDVNNFAIILPNARFEVREYGTDKVMATYKTANDGTFYITMDGKEAVSSIGPLSENKLYYIVEVEAPKGYQLPANPSKYYFFFSDSDTLPAGSTGSISNAVNLKKQSKQEYVRNEALPPSTSITINKEWQTENGTVTNLISGSISVMLKQVATTEAGQKLPAVDYWSDPETISYDGNKWSKTVANLPTRGISADGQAVTYSYYVEEKAVAGYETSYRTETVSSANPAEVTATNGSLTIINKAKKQYNLPNTGGPGIVGLRMMGMALAVLSLLLLSIKLFKNYQRGENL